MNIHSIAVASVNVHSAHRPVHTSVHTSEHTSVHTFRSHLPQHGVQDPRRTCEVCAPTVLELCAGDGAAWTHTCGDPNCGQHYESELHFTDRITAIRAQRAARAAARDSDRSRAVLEQLVGGLQGVHFAQPDGAHPPAGAACAPRVLMDAEITADDRAACMALCEAGNEGVAGFDAGQMQLARHRESRRGVKGAVSGGVNGEV